MDLGENTFIVALFEEFPSPWHGLYPRGTSFFGPGPFSPAFRIFPESSGPINCGGNAQIFRRFASKTPLWPNQPSSRSLLMFGDFLLKWRRGDINVTKSDKVVFSKMPFHLSLWSKEILGTLHHAKIVVLYNNQIKRKKFKRKIEKKRVLLVKVFLFDQ